MKLLFVLAGVILTTSALGDSDEWENYKITYGKTYKSIWEERQRFSVYLETMTRIEEHNEQFEKSKTTYKMGVTKFADWTQEEIDAFLKSSYSSSPSFKREYVPKFNKANLGIRPPAAYDWRDKNVVTEVKDQGECNAGWAFAAAGALETSLWYFTKKLRSISAQGLIDCIGSNVNGGNNACSPLNKTVKDAYDFMIEKGFAFDEDYPFISESGKSGECKISKFSEVLREYNVLPKGDEKNLQETVAFASPVAALIDATPLLNYESGIIDANASCKKDSPNHAVVIVGYGTDNGTDYWTLKNSFGKNWGEDGFFRLQRGSNVCGIASAAIQPVFRC